jgi:polyhydroxyalkanoate synthesis regulator phasin
VTKFWKLAGITALVAVLAVGAVAAVSAQTPTPSTGNKALDLWERMHEAIAKALGITVEQYDSAVDTARDDVLKQAVDEGLLTQEQADRMAERWQDGMGSMGMSGRGGRGGGFGGRGGYMMGGSGESVLLSVAAEKLGMTVEELQTELEADKTIADVAEAKGVELATIIDAYVAAKQEQVQQMVTDGRITQEQADKMIENLREQAQERLEGSLRFRGEFGPGCGDWNDQESTTPEGTSTLGRFQGMMRRGSY